MSTDQSAQGVSTDEATEYVDEIVACLGDDAAMLLRLYGDGLDEVTENMDGAATLIEKLVAERDALASRVRALEGEIATVAGLEAAVGHLSAMFDEQRRLLVEVEQVCGRDAYGIEFEDGDSELIDKVRAHLATTTSGDSHG